MDKKFLYISKNKVLNPPNKIQSVVFRCNILLSISLESEPH